MRKIILVLMAALLALPISAADEATRLLGYVLTTANTVAARYSATLNLVTNGDPAGAEYVADALTLELEARSTIRPGVQTEAYERLLQLMAKALGDWRYSNAAASLWRVVQESTEPLTQAEALISLGAIRATEYGERISLMLTDLNSRPARDPEAGEKLAYGAILALERMRFSSGFRAVFFAADAWYSQRVKEQAQTSLPLILADPSVELLDILRVESNPRRLRALQFSLASSLSGEQKIAIARLALQVGIQTNPANRAEATVLANLRKLSLNALVDLGDRSGAAATDFTAAYHLAERNNDVDEKLLALRAMGNDRSAASARELAIIITRLNDDQQAGRVNEERNRLMQAALEYAAISRSRELYAALQQVNINNGWSNTIIRLANEALQVLE